MEFDSPKNFPDTLLPDIHIKKYKLTDDAIAAVKILVEQTIEKLLRNVSVEDAVFKKYCEQLDKYMMKQYPDLSNRLNSLALNLDEKVKNLDKIAKELQKREKFIVKSETIYEDVYKIRDQVSEMSKFIEEFKKKLKKAFEI